MPTRAPSRRITARRGATALVVAVVTALAVTGCNAADTPVVGSHNSADKPSPSASPTASAATISANIRPGAKAVRVDKKISVGVDKGQLQHVTVKGPGGVIPGTLAADGSKWHATALLRPSSAYVVQALAVDDNGTRQKFQRSFHTRKLSLDRLTFPSFVPTDGQTVGVAMPVIIRFDVPVTDKASIQKHLQVISQPAQVGAFHWISDNEVHWRPRNYWRAGTDVTVKADIGSIPAGNGIFGQKDREMTFHVGRSMVTRVNMKTDQLKAFRNGKLLRTIPITTGMPGFTTRSGTKVIVEKFRRKDMNSETIGIDPNSANGYNMKGVEYAMRVTYTGEFLHAAPWSVGAQGHYNVSHGCTGMSTDNARWLYENSIVGDPVEYTGSDRPMTLTNGYGDWNEPFAKYKQGSAL